jgi:hypothetical protein
LFLFIIHAYSPGVKALQSHLFLVVILYEKKESEKQHFRKYISNASQPIFPKRDWWSKLRCSPTDVAQGIRYEVDDYGVKQRTTLR